MLLFWGVVCLFSYCFGIFVFRRGATQCAETVGRAARRMVYSVAVHRRGADCVCVCVCVRGVVVYAYVLKNSYFILAYPERGDSDLAALTEGGSPYRCLSWPRWVLEDNGRVFILFTPA